ncbi:MAG: hypothetical protein ABFD50_07360 [Smithella sp.]
MNPSLLIQFDPENWKSVISFNGKTDEETAKLKLIADKIKAAIEDKDE